MEFAEPVVLDKAQKALYELNKLKSQEILAAPKGTLGYAEVTSSQASITSEADLTSLTATVTVATSRRIRITGSVLFTCSAADNEARMSIKESTTLLQIAQGNIGSSAGNGLSIQRSVVLTPSAGSHTYKLSATRIAGAGELTMVAEATLPAFILVEDIGAA